MRDNILIVSSSEHIISQVTMKMNELGYYDITVCRSKEDAITKINTGLVNFGETGIMILDQDLKETEKSEKIVERNGEDIAMKLMQDDIEIPTYFIGSQTSKYQDDNIICKIDTTQEDVPETLEKTILQEQEKEKQEENRSNHGKSSISQFQGQEQAILS